MTIVFRACIVFNIFYYIIFYFIYTFYCIFTSLSILYELRNGFCAAYNLWIQTGCSFLFYFRTTN